MAIWSWLVLTVASKLIQSASKLPLLYWRAATSSSLGSRRHFLQAMLVARAVVGQLDVGRVSDVRQIAVVEEASVVHDVGVGLRILEARIVVLQREVKLNAAMRRQRRRKLVEIKAERRIFDQRGLASGEAELLDLDVRPRQRRDVRSARGSRQCDRCRMRSCSPATWCR